MGVITIPQQTERERAVEAEARRKAEAEAKRKAEEAKRKAEEERRAEAEAKRKAAEQAAHDSSLDRRQPVAMQPLTPISDNIYKGIIKFFRGSFGWISCKALEAEYPDCDIMVHKNDCHHFECNESGKPKQGNLVCFRLALNAQGDPQAVDVKIRYR